MKIKHLNVRVSFSILNFFVYSEQRSMKYAITIEPYDEKMPVNTVYCLGRNYGAHAHEMGATIPSEPIVFIKPATAVVNGELPINLPEFSNDIHHEIELVLLVDDVPRNTSEADSEKFIIAYGVGLDLTARDIQTVAKKQGLPWTVAKGFDGSAPVSRFQKASNTSLNENTRLQLTVNDEIKQQEIIGNMIYPIPSIISSLSRYFTLRRGDLIFTGTPEGVGPLLPGDTLIVELEGIVSFSTRIQKL
jgi:2-keto-4-pentenoate hydratase/2-oxohepta-3-ene-1,7-dioic acid hydratase in catechol pathway